MKKIPLLIPALSLLCAASAGAEVLDWDKIEHWSGEGTNRAALVVQFVTPSGTANPGALVWGYRWDGSQSLTSEQVFRSIASGSDDILILTQYTGYMGNTMDGIGFSANVGNILDNLEYDFEGASADSNISFGFFEPNTSMGQTSAPGSEAVGMVYEAISDAEETHIIEHPLDQAAFGYPAYDYDWWQLADTPANTFWNAGWYDGYWSFWCGGVDMDDLSYSGLGMSSVYVEDGDVYGWKYLIINEDDMNQDFSGYLDDNSSWLSLNYSHATTLTGIDIASEPEDGEDNQAGGVIRYFRIDGTPVATPSTPGIYIVKKGNKTYKTTTR